MYIDDTGLQFAGSGKTVYFLENGDNIPSSENVDILIYVASGSAPSRWQRFLVEKGDLDAIWF
jgi:hypothetical protein